MSQVDKVVYIPLLFWFIILFLGLYLVVYSYFLPLLFSSFKTRRLFFIHLIYSSSLGTSLIRFLSLYNVYFNSIYLLKLLSVALGYINLEDYKSSL
jgi:hypothetical protein